MKKTLALLLAFLMVVPMLVFPTTAEETTAAAEPAEQIIPVYSGGKLESGDWLGQMPRTDENGALGITIDGIPTIQSPGRVVEFSINSATPRDISGMNMLVFDLYLENVPGIANALFQFEIRSKDHGWADNYEKYYSGTLKSLVNFTLVEGWNHIEVPLTKFNGSAGRAFDPTNWTWFRFYQERATANDGTVTNPHFMIGTEGKSTVIKIDNIYFSSKSTVDEVESDSFIINNSYGTVNYTAAASFGPGDGLQYVGRPAAMDIRDYTTLDFDVYLSHEDAASRGFNIELTSSGGSDNQEDNAGDTLAVLAKRAGTTLVKGWNRISLPLTARTAGGMKPESFNFFRIFNNGWTAGTYEDGETRTIVFARAALGGKKANQTLVDIWDCTVGDFTNGLAYSNGPLKDVVTADGEVGSDGINEWVWVDAADSYTVAKETAWGQLSLLRAMPHLENFAGIQFDIWVSDAAYGTMGINFEFSSAGQCDWEEASVSSTLNSLTGTTLKAGEWQTVTILLSNLTSRSSGERGVFDPAEFDFMRTWKLSPSVEFANGLTVAVRNIKAINHTLPESEDEQGNPVLVMDNDFSSGSLITVTSKDGDAANKAFKMFYAQPGGTLIAESAYYANNAVLNREIDISGADHIAFDLYLENSDYWIDQVNFLFGMTSYGNCDHEQIHISNCNIRQMFGDYVVNEDGSKGELKDGWNRIVAPLYTLFYSHATPSADQYEADGTTIRSRSFDPTGFNYFRTYAQGQAGKAKVAEQKCVAAIDNMTFFDGGTIGTHDASYDFGVGEKFGKVYTGAAGKGARVGFATDHALDASDKDTLLIDVYVEKMDEYTGSFSLEVGSTWKSDYAEYEFQFTLQEKGAREGQWTTLEFALPSNWTTRTNMDVSKIVRFEMFNSTGALPAGYQLWVDNVRFVKRGTNPFGPAVTSAQPTLNENIDLTVKATTPTQKARAATVSFELTGWGADKIYSYAPATLLSTSDNGKTQTWATTFTGIPAHRMVDMLTMTVWYVDTNGVLCKGNVKTYSIQEYANNMLAKATDTKLITLLSDLLTYGAAAQTYANYSMDKLANAVEGLTPTEGFAAPEKLNNVVVGAATENGPKFRSVTLVLDGTVHIRYTFTSATLDGLTLTVGGKTYTDFASADGYYYVDVPVAANQFGTVYNAYFGDNTAYSVNYSVNHYIATKQPTAGAKLGALLEALYNYGASAAAYQ